MRLIDEDVDCDGQVSVEIIASRFGENLGYIDTVDIRRIHPISEEEFFSIYPNAEKVPGYDDLSKNVPLPCGDHAYMKEIVAGEKFVLTEERRDELLVEMMALLNEYEYHPTISGCNKILDEWAEKKGDLILLMSRHPNYNGKYQIAFDEDYNRICDSKILEDFSKYIRKWSQNIRKKYMIGCHSYQESIDIRDRMYEIINAYNTIRAHGGLYLKDYYLECVKNYSFFTEKVNKFEEANRAHLCDWSGCPRELYTSESLDLFGKVRDFSLQLMNYKDQFIDVFMADVINAISPTLKAVAGQKTSRIVNKFCHFIGIDKDPEYQRRFAQYSDAINPLKITRHTILSCHPIDYFTMSFGNSWASCHTIDKENKRGMEHAYEGCYSGGTLSYMLDGTSMVFYTVDSSYTGDQLELEPKINRNMFHLGEDKIVQGRIYPQATDGENSFYQEVREIVQKVISDCMNRPNIWVNKKGPSECDNVIDTYGVHYTDYLYFKDCNVSYLKNADGGVNIKRISVGHAPICPSCGREHMEEKTIECDQCFTREICCECEEENNTDDMHYIYGEWYCENCCFYCSYHSEWEIGSGNHIVGYGNVCDSALDEPEFRECDSCGAFYYIYGDSVETEDGRSYCNSSCAYLDGYRMVENGEWYPQNEVHHCEHCESLVHDSAWNSDHDCCDDCVDDILEENEDEAGINSPAA